MPAADPVLAMLGLAARAGALAPGTARVREAVLGGTVRLAVVAADASANAHDRLIPLLRRREVAHAVRYTRAELGAAVGRAGISAVGITDRGLARRCAALLDGAVEGGGAGEGTDVKEPVGRRRRS